MSMQIPATGAPASISSQAIALVSREPRQEPAARPQARRTAPPAVQARELQAQGEEVHRQQERLNERVEKLVQNMKGLAERISSPEVSPPQRTVLVGRFNDLQRKVDELDGIVVSEGKAARGRPELGNTTPAGRDPLESGIAPPSIFQPVRRQQAQTAQRNNSASRLVDLIA